MESQNYLEQVKALKQMLAKLPPASKEQADKLWKKFRLEWNYNSNHIEGNTLTYGQTELLIIFGKTSEGKDVREYEEMKAHDVAIKMVVEEAKDKERPLTENFIRLLNETILVSPFWKEAITPDGQTTRREIQIGQYKSMPNSVRLANGEIFNFASPQETPALIHDLVHWYNHQKDVDPVTLAAIFHHRFVRIHPFDDGNGRVARLLMNYILLKCDFPPVIIKSDDKSNYLLALNKADVGDLNAFVDYIAAQMIWSLDISIRAAKGQSVEETHDWKKELEILKRNLPREDSVKFGRNAINAQQIADEIMIPLINKITDELRSFTDLFTNYFPFIKTIPEPLPNAVPYVKGMTRIKIDPGTKSILLDIALNGYKKDGKNPFSVKTNLECELMAYKYNITYTDQAHIISKLYDEKLTSKEEDEIVSAMANDILSQINGNLRSV